jgi:hypothetical protein
LYRAETTFSGAVFPVNRFFLCRNLSVNRLQKNALLLRFVFLDAVWTTPVRFRQGEVVFSSLPGGGHSGTRFLMHWVPCSWE